MRTDGTRNSLLSQPWSLARTGKVFLNRHAPTWPDARVVVFDTPVDAATARTWMPRGLRLPAAPRATIFVADYPSTSFGVAYRECGVLLHALRRGREVVHCAWMVVDDDTAMILGRELLGFPKKLARIELQEADGRVHAAVVRRGTELLRLEARLGEGLTARKAFPQPIVNVRGNPGFFPQALWQMTVPERFHGGHAAALEVEVRGSAEDPLDRLAIGTREAAGAWLNVDLGAPPPDAGPVPRGVYPVGLVSPLWMARAYPFRVL